MAAGLVPTHRAPRSGLLVWDAPESDRKVVAQLGGGAAVEVLEWRPPWAHIRLADGRIGWVEQAGLETTARTARGRWSAVLAVTVLIALVAAGLFFYIKARTTQGEVPSTITGPGEVSAASLLVQAYSSGTIDRDTWLRYRAYSMFGAHSLPGNFQAGTPDQDDTALAAELQRGDPLPADVRAELLSYLGRPTAQGSVFYGGGPVRTQGTAASHTVLADTVTCDANRWTSQASQKSLFRVWARCTAGFASRLSSVIDILDQVWYDETGVMGQPVQDFVPAVDPSEYGGDGLLDVYLIPRGIDLARNGQTVRIDGIDAGVAVPAPPFNGNSSSGYILLDEAATSQPGLRSTLAHELFHVLEYARNYVAHWERAGLTHGFAMEENWFAEASAVWAEFEFARSSAPSEVYQRVAAFLQNAAMPLDARGATGSPQWLHAYQDFMWLVFMEQEAGVKAISSAWKSSLMATATTGTQATAAFDESFPFARHSPTSRCATSMIPR